jgi:choice-of-anchor A domain-containing protein
MLRAAPRSTIRLRFVGVYFLALAVVVALFGTISSNAAPARQATPEGVTPHDVTPPDISGPLGQATDFNVFVFNDAVLTIGAVAGRVAVGDDAFIDGASIGHLEDTTIGSNVLDESQGRRDSLIVGGHLAFRAGRLSKGNVTCDDCDETTIGDIFDPGTVNTWFETSPVGIDFDTAQTALTALSERIGQQPANGTVRVEQSVVTFSGTDNDLNLFSVAGADLTRETKAPSIVFDVPAGSEVIVNITGPRMEWEARDIRLGNADPRHILLNFPEAETILSSEAFVEGTVLAPKADVVFGGIVNGQVIANNLVSFGYARSFAYQPQVSGGGGTPAAEVQSLFEASTQQQSSPQPTTGESGQATIRLATSAVRTNAVLAGDEVTFNFTVSNAGTTPLSNITITDLRLGNITNCLQDLSTLTLQPGESVECAAPYTAEIADAPVFLDSAQAEAVAPDGTAVDDRAVVAVNVYGNELLTLVTEVNPRIARVGDTVTYTYRIVNTGTQAIPGITLTDDTFGAITCPQDAIPPGESLTCLLTRKLTTADMGPRGVLLNTAVATGQDSAVTGGGTRAIPSMQEGGAVVTDEDPAALLVMEAQPAPVPAPTESPTPTVTPPPTEIPPTEVPPTEVPPPPPVAPTETPTLAPAEVPTEAPTAVPPTPTPEVGRIKITMLHAHRTDPDSRYSLRQRIRRRHER